MLFAPHPVRLHDRLVGVSGEPERQRELVDELAVRLRASSTETPNTATFFLRNCDQPSRMEHASLVQPGVSSFG
jgi:hypothetical protein